MASIKFDSPFENTCPACKSDDIAKAGEHRVNYEIESRKEATLDYWCRLCGNTFSVRKGKILIQKP